MLGLLDGMRELTTIVVDAVIVFAEVTCLHDFVEKELAFFFVRLADQVFVGHGEDSLKDTHHSACKLLHAEARESVHYHFVG